MELSEVITLKDLGFSITFEFPEEARKEIVNAVKSVDIVGKQGLIQKNLDLGIAGALKPLGYYCDVNGDPECKLWLPEFRHSVDFYNPIRKVAIEVEKAEIKRVIHDILKLVNATKTFKSKIRYGVLIVPDKYIVNSKPRLFLSGIKNDISFYFGSLLDETKLYDLLIIAYKVTEV